jgi:transcriptional regulator with XRE-family HTH domain
MGSTQPLRIRVGEHSYTAEPADAPIVIGRELPAHIQIDDPYVSRTHVRLEPVEGHWCATDQSRNGIYPDGATERQATVAIVEGTTIRLGNPKGVPVSFGFDAGAGPMADAVRGTVADPVAGPIAEADPEEGSDTWTGEVTDPGVARAGAAVAARRDELNITQRELARQKIMNAGALIAFEKGRSWPRRKTLAKLEDVLGWPPGTITRIRYGEPAGDEDRTEVLTNTVQSSYMAQAVELALDAINAKIKSLPESSDNNFGNAVADVLRDLRKLQGVAADGARSAHGAPEMAIALSAVRKAYTDVMLRAARSPNATLGQRLFAARHRAELSLDETAGAAGVPADVILAAEADAPLTGEVTTALTALLAALSRR